MRFGVDFHRIHRGLHRRTNVLGSFTFSGYATENPAAQKCNSSTTTCTFTRIGSAARGLPAWPAAADASHRRAQQDLSARQLVGLVRAGRLAREVELHDQLWPALGVLLSLLGEVRPARQSEPERDSGCFPADRQRLRHGRTRLRTGVRCGTPGTLVNPDKALYSPRVAIALVAEVQVHQEYSGAFGLWHQLQHRAVFAVCARRWRSSSPSPSRRRTRATAPARPPATPSDHG